MRVGRFVALVVALALALAACSSSGSGSGSQNGGTLRIGTTDNIDTMNPFATTEQTPLNIFTQIYPQLVQYDGHLNFVPYYARSWHQSTDGKTWIFHLQPHAEWSDGVPLTATDAAWTLNTIVKYAAGPTSSYAGATAHMIRATALNSDTLQVNYAQPVANVLANLEEIPILPEHVWGPLAKGNGGLLKTYPNVPTGGKPLVGGGPWILSQYTRNTDAIFSRNPHWWGAKAHIDHWGLALYSDDDAMATALKTNQIDAVAYPGIAPTDAATLKKAGLFIYSGPGMSFKDFIINSSPDKQNTRELLNPLVREAFNVAINRQQIDKVAWLGFAQPGASIIPPATGIWSDPAIKAPPFDIPLANKLLNQAGYLRGSNGIRMADGHPMSYTVDFASDESGPGDRAFQIIHTDFAQIGVQISQRVLDSASENTAIYGPNSKYQTFQLGMWDWTTLIDPDFMLMVLTCSQWGNWSDSGYCNHTYDHLYSQQGLTLNKAKRLQIVYRMQQIIAHDLPYLVLNYVNVLEAWNPKWTGFVESPEGFFNQLSTASLLSVHRT